MQTTTKLAIGAGVGLLALGGIAFALSGDAKAAMPTPARLTAIVPGKTYRFGLVDSGGAPTASIQTALTSVGWQIQSFESLGTVNAGGGSANSYGVTGTWTGNPVDLSAPGTSALDTWNVGLSTGGNIAVTHIQGPL